MFFIVTFSEFSKISVLEVDGLIVKISIDFKILFATWFLFFIDSSMYQCGEFPITMFF